MVIWLTGLSGAGKSTVASALAHALSELGRQNYVLDGDLLRKGLCQDLGFSAADREENIRRSAEVCKLLDEIGLIVISAFISPFCADRERARALIGAERFIEVFIDTPLSECERRDPKGLYAKARAGLLANFTGIDSPYQAPLNPALVINTLELETAAAVEKILVYLQARADF